MRKVQGASCEEGVRFTVLRNIRTGCVCIVTGHTGLLFCSLRIGFESVKFVK